MVSNDQICFEIEVHNEIFTKRKIHIWTKLMDDHKNIMDKGVLDMSARIRHSIDVSNLQIQVMIGEMQIHGNDLQLNSMSSHFKNNNKKFDFAMKMLFAKCKCNEQGKLINELATYTLGNLWRYCKRIRLIQLIQYIGSKNMTEKTTVWKAISILDSYLTSKTDRYGIMDMMYVTENDRSFCLFLLCFSADNMMGCYKNSTCVGNERERLAVHNSNCKFDVDREFLREESVSEYLSMIFKESEKKCVCRREHGVRFNRFIRYLNVIVLFPVFKVTNKLPLLIAICKHPWVNLDVSSIVDKHNVFETVKWVTDTMNTIDADILLGNILTKIETLYDLNLNSFEMYVNDVKTIDLTPFVHVEENDSDLSFLIHYHMQHFNQFTDQSMFLFVTRTLIHGQTQF